MPKSKLDYPYLRAWCRMMGSYRYYIEDQLEMAREAKAPQNATYEEYDSKGPTGKWHTYDQVTSPNTRNIIDTIIDAWKAEGLV